MTRALFTLLGLAGMAAAAVATPAAVVAPDTAYRAQIQKWRDEREARLKGDGGWLQVAGLFWLKEGANAFGADPKSAIALPAGSAPTRAGVFELKSGKVTVRLEPGVEATVEGKPV